MGRTTWVEVDRAGLKANYAAVAAHAGVPVCAVVKANGYGHGLVEAASMFSEAGAPLLAVTRHEEAMALRSAAITTPILILMPTADQAASAAAGFEITVGSPEQVATVPSGATVHLKIDTGMGRLGIRTDEALEAAHTIARTATLATVWTHFSEAASPAGRIQLERFRSVVTGLRHAGIDVRAHAANSPAICSLVDAMFDMVRPGTLLYGQDPPGAHAPFPLRDTFAWYAAVTAVRDVPEGFTVGYGAEWVARRPTRVATIPVGFADGIGVEPVTRTPGLRETARGVAQIAARAMRRTRPMVRFGDVLAPVIGRVAMQAITVSLDGLPDIGEGSIARIPARRLMVDPSIERVLV